MIQLGAGQVDQQPGQPYPAPDAFNRWLETTICAPATDQKIILGLVRK